MSAVELGKVFDVKKISKLFKDNIADFKDSGDDVEKITFYQGAGCNRCRNTGYRAPLSVEGTRRIDNVLLHRFWGPLLFLAVVVGVFEVVFSIGQPLSDGFGAILARIGGLMKLVIPSGWLQSLLLDGAWKGISSVLVFLPQILLLFLYYPTTFTISRK